MRECWLFDPEGFKLPAPLAGHRLRAGRYRPVVADASGVSPSGVLGLGLHVRAGELRFRDLATGRDLRACDEAEQRSDAAELERAAEKNRADAAERELARLHEISHKPHGECR